MEESKAPIAEKIYRDARIDTSKVCYALVYLRKGEASLADIMLNEQSLRELAGSEEMIQKYSD